jgi:hypothetical protein
MTDEKLRAPGLCRRKRADGEALYWVPRPADVKRGYPIKSLAIPSKLGEAEIVALCVKYQTELEAWRNGAEAGPARYSFAWLIRCYMTDESSTFHKLGHNSKRNYIQDCKIIENTIGQVRFDLDGEDRIVGDDLWRWHKNWGVPGPDGKPTKPSRARHTITMLRILIKHAEVKGCPGAKELAGIATAMRFPTTCAREIVPELKDVLAIVNTALEQNYRSIAIATLAQFELTERRISIIGSWESGQWRPGWLWSGISKDWKISYTQNKRGVNKREYDLKTTPLLLSLIQRTQEDKRVGPVIVCESTGLPWKEKHYTDTFREIARAADVPDDLCSMDMRAGGATEADAIGVTDRELQDAGGWGDPKMKDRYRRDKQRNAQNVVILRQKARQDRG